METPTKTKRAPHKIANRLLNKAQGTRNKETGYKPGIHFITRTTLHLIPKCSEPSRMVNHNKYVPEEWEPSMFTLKEVKDIEEAWQYASAVMSHYHVDQDVFDSIDNLLAEDDNSASEEEEHLLILSPVERL